MKNRAIVSLGLSVFVFGGATVGCTSGQGRVASASSQDPSRVTKQANAQAAKAAKDLARGNMASAIARAESAVQLRPYVAAFRMLLGQSYLKAGRFTSARTAFADAIVLEPGNGKAALNLALAEIGVGDWTAARRTLDANAAIIPASDRGLAMALAGDPASAVELLGSAARMPDADAKTRQNFGLSLALAGRWQEAKAVVAVDVAPDQVDARLRDWAAFAQPQSASQQVAALLGVTPVADPGQPVALALYAKAGEPALASADAAPIDSYMPGKPGESQASAQAAIVPAAAAEPAPQLASAAPAVRFAARAETIQPLPGGERARAAAPSRRIVATVKQVPPAAPTARAMAKGNFFVQLGAYDNAAVAKDAWVRATRSYAAFRNHNPSGMGITSRGSSFYRLSVGGFAQADAKAMCASYKAHGGTCFVRAGAGDQVAVWARGPKLASR